MRRRISRIVLSSLCAMTLGLGACAPGEAPRGVGEPERLADYLYRLDLDEYNFSYLPSEGSPVFTFACSSVRKGDLFGRNLDIGYCDAPEFVINLSAAEGRFASVGLCADPTVTFNVSEMTEAELLAMPNVTNDGINENGVIVSVHVVDSTGVDDMTGTAPGKRELHSSRVVRYLLDRAESAEHAVSLLGEVNIVGGFSGYALHYMIADETDTYMVEIIGGKLTVSRNEHFCMTNFYLNLGPVLAEQHVAGTTFENVPALNDYAIGVERWCIMRDGYDDITNEEDMVSLLESVRATATYDKTNCPLWYTECTGGGISIHSDAAAFEDELDRQIACFEARDRANPQGDYITWHSSVYNIAKRTLCVYSQEDYSKCYRFELGK